MRFTTLVRSLTAIATFAALLHAAPVRATHMMGAELTYSWLGGNEYVLRLTVWRDCQVGGGFTSMAVQYTSSCGIGTATLAQADTLELTSNCNGLLTTCQGGGFPGADLLYFRDTITLTPCADWTFSWALCCRNAAILNLVDADTQDLLITASLDNLNQPGNSSPIFQELTGPFVCANTPVCVANTSYDPDGDSLVYSMTAPLGALGAPLVYLPGYSNIDPFPSTNGHAFDPTSGNHCATPNTIGAYVVAYEVQEWRNGIVVGRSHRDLQMWVVNCPPGNMVISGTVNDTLGAAVTGGGVELYEYGLNATGSVRIDSIAVGAGGDYAFAAQPIGQYLVRAIPDAGLYPGTATSYHTSTYYWGYADVVHSLCDTTMVADIQLVSIGNLNGTGYLEGYLGDLGIVRSEGPGDPWPDQGIALEHWPDANLAGYVRTDANGVFQFQNVLYGTYRILVDHPGLPMLSYYIVTLDANTPSITGLAHGADPQGVYTFIATSVSSPQATQLQLVPNPSNGEEVILVGMAPGSYRISILDAAGRVARSERISSMSDRLEIATHRLTSGVYSIVIDELPGLKLRLVQP
ncbi:MAG: hypothetical protein IPO12_03925 [Flavobacteriales bacterium]|nr:hypothetical protein [Flavobacteriales bacterium]